MSDPQRGSDYSCEPDYLAKYVQTWTCQDGRVVKLRPIRPDDKRLEKLFIEGLSGESSRYRFFERIKEATPQMLSQFCDIDYKGVIAIMAEYDFGDEKRNVGVGRLILDPAAQDGEFAIVVADDFHNSGLGRKLMSILIDIGREKGLKSIYGTVLKDNSKMLSLAKKLGFVIESISSNEVKVILPL